MALDLTARDLQSAAKERGLPWSVPKGYDARLHRIGFKKLLKVMADALKMEHHQTIDGRSVR